jgi:hypothetical protein
MPTKKSNKLQKHKGKQRLPRKLKKQIKKAKDAVYPEGR